MRFHWMSPLFVLGCLASISLCQTAKAQIVNGSFESGSFTFGSDGGVSLPAGSTAITGWTTINAEIAVLTTPNNYNVTAPDGLNSLDLTGYHDSQPYGGIRQTVNTVAGQNYDLKFFIGSSATTTSIAVDTGGAPTTFTNPGGGGFNFLPFTYNFTATGPSVITLLGTVASTGNYIGLDGVTLTPRGTAPGTPGPGSLALLVGMGLSGSVFLKRRNRNVR
jgi:hypothetical protein